MTDTAFTPYSVQKKALAAANKYRGGLTFDNDMVPGDSNHPSHAGMFKVLSLLKINATPDHVYLVVEAVAFFCEKHELVSDLARFYNESTCPVNYMSSEAVIVGGDHDPHGFAEFVDAVWMTNGYLAAKAKCDTKEWLCRAFPALMAMVDDDEFDDTE
jgi:hypothetical protein